MKSLSEIAKSNSASNGLTRAQHLSPSTQERLSKFREKYPTVHSFVMDFHPDKSELFASYPDRCLFGTSPTLTDLKLTYDGRADMQWLIVQLTTFQEKVNIPQKMTSFQIETLAQTISEEFNHLKTTEIMLFLARLQGGAYSVDWYGSVSPDKIIGALREQFMPWRNRQFYLKEKEEEERKRDEAIHSENNISWEQFVAEKKAKGEEVLNNKNPLI